MKKQSEPPEISAAWEIAQQRAPELIAKLTDRDLTAQRYAVKNSISIYKAKQILNGLTDDGLLERSPRRLRNGNIVQAYVMKGDK